MLVNINDPDLVPPVVEKSPRLQYPPLALRQRIEGIVELKVLVDETGRVADVEVVKSAGGRSALDKAAMKSVRKRRYRPATKNGVAVKVWLSVRVNFKLPK
jgi:protein TonB